MFPFMRRARGDAWQRVGRVSAFPDIGPNNDDNYRIAPRCKAFSIPKTDSGAGSQCPVEADIDLPGDLKDQVLVFRYKGKVHAIDHQCPHSSFPLSQGTIFDIEDFGITLSAGVTCPKHGWAFDIFSGQADRGNYKLKIWEVQLRDPPENGGDTEDKEVWEQVIGYGSSALVLLQDGVAVRTPLRCIWSSDYDVDVNIQSLRREQDVYRRLHSLEDDRSKGIVRCLGFSTEATRLAYMSNGDLRTYLAKCRPSRQLQLAWCYEMARILCYVHDRRVLVADISSQNLLLDCHLSIKMCDFSEASLLPLEADMETVDDNGFTTQIDIGLLGAVMYEVVTGTRCKVDLFKDNSPSDGRAHWPDRETLPSTQEIWLGAIIEGCWKGEFRTAHSLLQALDSVDPNCTFPIS
ncbi:kinase-like protein [Aspergillus terreus]|uniref:Kinase-like protein n=1 Tax=Aspergillus terreus TaxID=33178 RepID=A0A5M3Z661_ASPTE|nr:hypothetical protein ATETN484_0009042300 [Aspergillus terreus]GFF17874.1 kinase-like protein [Aspergillus terreus]